MNAGRSSQFILYILTFANIQNVQYTMAIFRTTFPRNIYEALF